MDKYNEGQKAQWFNRMFDAGWRFWLWQDNAVVWRHADENVELNIKESRDMFRQFVNTKGNYIPTPYEVAQPPAKETE